MMEGSTVILSIDTEIQRDDGSLEVKSSPLIALTEVLTRDGETFL